ncbi:MAG: APC family permease [Planctomycetota bacterium]|nr:APC family permease [Planctomycetota bacterium]
MTTSQPPTAQAAARLKRQLGWPGATVLGLGSILGTGVFVSLGLSAEVAGPAVVLAIALAGLLATCNALSSAQLAANHPQSGGTYEYGYRYLRPWLGISAGWMFLAAKSASAATAALGFASYLAHFLKLDPTDLWVPGIALLTIAVATLTVLCGIERSRQVTVCIVAWTLLGLVVFIISGLPAVAATPQSHWQPFFATANAHWAGSWGPLLKATALMFVAYAGYGRIATLGEEVHEPHQTIPRAIIVTLLVTGTLYVLVGIVAVGSIGAVRLVELTRGQGAFLEILAREFANPGVRIFVGTAALTALLSVLLNLVLGLSRVVLAMGRRGDLPSVTAQLNAARTTPFIAVLLVGLAIAGLASLGSVKTTWSFSAMTVLTYYAITNLAALQLAPQERLYHPLFAWLGLGGCLLLACWVDALLWVIGVSIALGGILVAWLCQLGSPRST